MCTACARHHASCTLLPLHQHLARSFSPSRHCCMKSPRLYAIIYLWLPRHRSDGSTCSPPLSTDVHASGGPGGPVRPDTETNRHEYFDETFCTREITEHDKISPASLDSCGLHDAALPPVSATAGPCSMTWSTAPLLRDTHQSHGGEIASIPCHAACEGCVHHMHTREMKRCLFSFSPSCL